MTPTDLPVFSERVIQVYEALGHKPPTALAMQAWVQTMKEFAFADVSPVLDGWLKRSNKPPTPSDVWKACNDVRTERIEQAAKVEKVQFRLEAESTFRRSDKVGRALRTLAVELRDRTPTDPKEWAHVLWHRYVADRRNEDGSAMSEIQVQFACTALHRTRDQANESRAAYRAAQREMEPA